MVRVTIKCPFPWIQEPVDRPSLPPSSPSLSGLQLVKTATHGACYAGRKPRPPSWWLVWLVPLLGAAYWGHNCSGLSSWRTSLSPFTKDFRGEGHSWVMNIFGRPCSSDKARSAVEGNQVSSDTSEVKVSGREHICVCVIPVRECISLFCYMYALAM